MPSQQDNLIHADGSTTESATLSLTSANFFADGNHPDVALKTLQFLTVQQLAHAGQANHFLHTVADEECLWHVHLQAYLVGKVHVKDMETPSKATLHQCIQLASCTWMLTEALTSFQWNFRFKKQAGQQWTSRDPHAQGLGAAHAKFHTDGTVQFIGMPGLDDQDITWSWASTNVMPRGLGGSSLRLTMADHPFPLPTYIVTRHTNWGFILQNCWGIFTSFPMPPKGSDPMLEDEHMMNLNRAQEREAFWYKKRNSMYISLFRCLRPSTSR